MTELPTIFNAAAHFVDRNVDEGRGDHVAIECGDERVTYRQVQQRVNRVGSALTGRLGIQPEEREEHADEVHQAAIEQALVEQRDSKLFYDAASA